MIRLAFWIEAGRGGGGVEGVGDRRKAGRQYTRAGRPGSPAWIVARPCRRGRWKRNLGKTTAEAPAHPRSAGLGSAPGRLCGHVRGVGAEVDGRLDSRAAGRRPWRELGLGAVARAEPEDVVVGPQPDAVGRLGQGPSAASSPWAPWDETQIGWSRPDPDRRRRAGRRRYLPSGRTRGRPGSTVPSDRAGPRAGGNASTTEMGPAG